MFTQQPGDAPAGTTLDPPVVVEVRDQHGNPFDGFSGKVSLAIENDPAEGRLDGTTTVAASGGVATFTDLRIETAGEDYTLRATASGLDLAVSEYFEIRPAPADLLAFSEPPSDSEGGEPFDPPVTVEVRDEYGNLVPGHGGSATIALGVDPTDGRATLSGALTADLSDGTATFSDVSIDVPGSGYTLEASSGTLTGSSPSFDIRLTFRQARGGGGHTCGVTVVDRVYCWGLNASGQLGTSTSEVCAESDLACARLPTAVETPTAISQLTSGWQHTCAVSTTNGVYCWGENRYGRIGDGTTTDRSSPVSVSTSASFSEVSAGRYHTCGLTTEGSVFCWGRNSSGQLGDGTTNDQSVPVEISSTETFVQVSAGGIHSCGLTTTEEIYCWGSNTYGQLGDGTTTDRSVPVPVSSSESFSRVSAGESHTCALTTQSVPYCWGNNSLGQVGDGTETDRETPVPVSTSRRFSRIATATGNNGFHTCGVSTRGETFCWGANGNGELGDGTTTDRAAPVPISVTLSMAEVAPGEGHTCGTTTEGHVHCWGYNEWGQLGNGTTTDRYSPVEVNQ